MNNTTRVITSAAAAVAIATGAYFTIDSSNDPENVTQEAIAQEVAAIDLEQYIPDIFSYIPEIPNFNQSIKEASSQEEFQRASQIEVPQIEKYDFNKNIIKSVERMQKLQKHFRDQRSINHDQSVFDNEFVEKWISIYKEYKDRSFDKIPIRKQYRMISEVMLPKNETELNILKTNLDYYKSRGYDSVLIVIDGSEDPSELVNLAKFIRYQGFEYFFAFGGNENLKVSIFVDPDKLKDQLQALAEYGSGLLTGWRRTSAHLLLQDDAFMNYQTSCVREKNQNIFIIGEIYYGNTAEYSEAEKWGFGINLPNYASGCMIMNFGFLNTDIKSIVQKLIPSKIGDVDLFGVVVGQTPYYLTEQKNNFGQEKNQKIKERIESKFIKAGCKGTITFQDDGRHGFDEKPNNNLSNTVYTELK